ncbi:hypothetical protein M9Y10_016424 [Tritrichomonas musculus]|uniref:Chorein N-terminal domain-containing protein n=1 Tax=Tritrichomonas musculus TaxID=1915356 RepID=A0ABR2HWJ9_9EUKA
MLETVVAKFITKYLCEYIETINKNQMEMKLWEGHATFENLILLPTALSYHQLPFKIIKGIIKRVHLNFPWKKLDTEACIIEVEDVYILAQPDPEVLIKNDIEAQQSAIHISLTDNDSGNESQEISKEFEIGTWQSLINTVIDNARISIKNIHIRVEYNYIRSKAQSPLNSGLPSASPSASSLSLYANISDKIKNDDSEFNDDDQETKFASGGLIIPELTLFTVDDDNKPLLKVVQAANKLRKQFKLNNISVYFDTHDKKTLATKNNKLSNDNSDSNGYFTQPINLNKFEEEMKKIMLDDNHQFILNPFYIEGILLHTRNLPDMLKNIVEITTHQLKFSLDYEQEQVLLFFNREWNRFTKRRRYAACARPKGTINSKQKVFEFWKYFTRCAIQRSRPNEFNPELAITILKFRLKYLKLIRKYETQSNIMHPLLDSQLKTLDKKVGTSAALFCRAYSKAVVTKELNVKNSGITAFDLSELKGLLKTTDRFFDIDSFSAKLNIPSFQFELLYEKNDPFLVSEFKEINLTINSVKGGADVHFSIDDFNVISYVNEIQRSIVYVEFDNQNNQIDEKSETTKNYFFKVDFIIPSTTDPFQINVYLEPTVTIIDSITIDRVFTFFDERDNVKSASNLNLTELDDKNVKINRIDAADTFQRLLYFKNHMLNVEFKKLTYIFPFEYQHKQTSINFAVKNFAISKSAVGLLAKDTPEIKMDFRVHFTIDDLMIDDCCVLKEFEFDFPFFFKFYTRIDQVCLDCNFVFGKINFEFGERDLKLIIAAINYGKMIKLTETQRKQLVDGNLDKNEISSFLQTTQNHSNQAMPKTKTIISFGKVTVNLSFNFEELKINIDSANTSVEANSIKFSFKIIKGESEGLCTIGKISFIEDNEQLLSLPDNSMKIVAYQKDETEKMKITFVIDNLQILMGLRRYKKIYLKFIKMINYFIKEIDFESFLLDYNKNYQKINNSNKGNTLNRINSAYLFSKKNSKLNFELEKGKNNRSQTKINIEEEEEDLYDLETKSLSSIFKDIKPIEEPEKNEKDKKDEDESLFEMEFQINNFEVLIPDKKGKSLVTIGKLTITDHIEMIDFGCYRENRILIKPMPIVLHFDQLKNMKLGHLDSQFDPSDLWAILRFVDDLQFFFNDSNEDEEEDEEEEQYESRVIVSFESSRFDLYNYKTHLFIVETEEVIIDVLLRKDETFTSITINKAKANQFIFTNNEEENKYLYKFVDFDDPITYKYHSKGQYSTFKLVFPETIAYFTQYDYQFIFRWIPADDDLYESESEISEKSKSHYKIKCASSKVVMMQGLEQVGTLVFNELKIDLTWIGNSNVIFELQFSDINGYTNLLGNNFHFISLPHGFYLRYHDDSLLITGKQVIVSFNIPLLLKVIYTLIEILADKNADPDSDFVFNINMKIEVDEITANVYPLEMIGPLTQTRINNTRFALKAQQKLVAMSIDNILLDVASANPDRALSISNFQGILTLNEDVSLSEKLEKMEIDMNDTEKIYNLDDFKEPEGFVLNKIDGNLTAKNITINYTHRFAAAIILDIIPKGKEMRTLTAEQLKNLGTEESIFLSLVDQQKEIMKKYELKPIQDPTDNQNKQLKSKENKNNELQLILTASVNSFYFVIYLIDPLATIEFLDLTANVKDKAWKATMGAFHLYQASDIKSNLIKSHDDSKLLRFEKNDDIYSIELDEMEICVDLAFYLNVFNFILRSPILYISDLQNHKDEIKSNSMASLPFNLKVKAPKLKVSIPTLVGSNQKICPLFHIDMNCQLHLVESTVELEVSDFSVYFSNPITHDIYVPLFDNVTMKFIKKSSIISDVYSHYEEHTNNDNENNDDESVVNDNESDEVNVETTEDDTTEEENIYSTSLTFYLSDIEFKLSVIDLIIFKNMILDISKATNSLTFTDDDNNIIKNKKDLNNETQSNSITSVTFQTEKFRLIICKDNKTSSKYVPLFNLVIPPISFRLNNTEESGSTMKLSISPYVEYFNESTSLWDMIIEPFNLEVSGYFLNNNIKFAIKIDFDSNLNINLPFVAMTQLLELLDTKKSQLLDFGEYVELPNFWIENNLGRQIEFQLGNSEVVNMRNHFILGNQQKIPVYQLDQSTEIHITVDNKKYSCIPKLLTYPTFLSYDIVAVRKPYHGGTNIIIKSSTEIQNDLDFDVIIYTRKKSSDKNSESNFLLIGTVESKKRFPLQLPTTVSKSSSKSGEFLFAKKDAVDTTKSKHQIISLSKRSPQCTSSPVLLANFIIRMGENRGMYVNLSVQNDTSTGTRLYKLYSPNLMASNLPLESINVKIDNVEYKLPRGRVPRDLCIQAKGLTVNTKVSLYGKKYGPSAWLSVGANNKTQIVQTEIKNVSIAVAFDTTTIGSEENKITTMIFFSPCIIYNNTTEFMTVYEYDAAYPENNASIDIGVSRYGLYMPKMFSRSLKMTKYVQLKLNNSRDQDAFIDIQTPRTANAFLNVLTNTKDKTDESKALHHLKYGIRYDVSVKNSISVVTFSPLIKVRNELKFNLTLHAIYRKRKKLKGDQITVHHLNNTSNEPNEMLIMKMTSSGIFAFSVPTVSVLIREVCLIKEQRICFKVDRQGQSEGQSSDIFPYYMIELTVTDVGTYYEAIFREATFPTPVLIENCLQVEVSAFQLDENNPIRVDPDSTSIFGFDDALDCTSLYFLFSDGQRLHISTAEETRMIETYATVSYKESKSRYKINRTNSSQYFKPPSNRSKKKKEIKLPVFVEVKLLINGSMAVILTHKKSHRKRTLMRINPASLGSSSSSISASSQAILQYEGKEKVDESSDNKSESEIESQLNMSVMESSMISTFSFPLSTFLQVELEISSIHVSLIDMQTREIALLTFEQVKGSYEHKDNLIRICFSVKDFQLDDQDVSAPNPVCFVGHSRLHAVSHKKSDNDNDNEKDEELVEKPFFRLECLIPSDVPLMSRFSYLAANFQRADALFDSAFLSDSIYLLMNLMKPIKTKIGPQQPKNQIIDDDINQNENDKKMKIVTSLRDKKYVDSNKTLSTNINWLEMSPLYVNFGYNRKSGRKNQFNDPMPGLKYIPSLSPDQLIIPGVIMEHVIGEPKTIIEKVSSEYKTTTFNQIISMLGSTGLLLQTFGVTSLIAELLGVKVESDSIRFPSGQPTLDSYLNSPSDSNSQFDNRKDVSGPFSNESLSHLKEIIKSSNFKSSHIINALFCYNNRKQLKNENDINFYKHHNIENFDMYINHSISKGVFGVLKGNGIEKNRNAYYKEQITMDYSARKRVPRAFLNNKIEIFDEKYAIAQKTVGKGRIRMAGHLSLSDKTFKTKKPLLVVLTDNFVYILSPDIKNVIIKINIASLEKLSVSDKFVTMAASEKIVVSKVKHFSVVDNEPECIVECESDEMASRMYVFIQSQRLMLLTYGNSLID